MELFIYLLAVCGALAIIAMACLCIMSVRGASALGKYRRRYAQLQKAASANSAEWLELKENILEDRFGMPVATLCDLLGKTEHELGFARWRRNRADMLSELIENGLLDFTASHALLIHIDRVIAYGSHEGERLSREYSKLLGEKLRSLLYEPSSFDQALQIRSELNEVIGFGERRFANTVREYRLLPEWNKAVVSALDPDPEQLLLDGFRNEDYEVIITEAQQGIWASVQVLRVLISQQSESFVRYLSSRATVQLLDEMKESAEVPVC